MVVALWSNPLCTAHLRHRGHAAPPQISAGRNFSLFLKPDGSLWAWGYNYYGQLGIGTSNASPSPVQIGTDTNWVSIACRQTGMQWGLNRTGPCGAWGGNWNGQVGNNTTTDQYSPVRIGTDSDWVSVASGWDHTLALKSDGSLWAWGHNDDGQLGNGTE